jgi:hypothetical protein
MGLLASVSWGGLTDRAKLMVVFEETGRVIDRESRSSFWACGRRFIFDDYGDLKKVLNYTTDGRMNERLISNGC